MSLKIAARVKQTTTTTGTGTVDLDGTSSGFQTFVAGIGDGEYVPYYIFAGTEWEHGVGKITDAATDTLSREYVISSSDSNALVNFSTGTKTVTVGPPAGPGGLPHGHRNLIINGAMNVDQRCSDSVAINITTSSRVYGPDRWWGIADGSGDFDIERDAAVGALEGFKYALKATVQTTDTPAAAEAYSIGQDIEGYRCQDIDFGVSTARDIVVSCWTYTSVAGVYCFNIKNTTVNRSYTHEITLASSTWEYHSWIVPGDTTTLSYDQTTGSGIFLSVCLGAGSDFDGTDSAWATANDVGSANQVDWISNAGATFYLTGVQIEVGRYPTKFEYRHYGEELALCQRYYTKTFDDDIRPINDQGNFLGALTCNIAGAGASPYASWRFPVSMRTAPTVTLFNPRSGTDGQWTDNTSDSAHAAALAVGETGCNINNDWVDPGTSNWFIHAQADAEF